MAARRRLPLLFHLKLVHTDSAVKEPSYPPIVHSLTAKSKGAKARRLEEWVKQRIASPVEEKIASITRMQRKKFVVYPQTFARNADRWYQHFTKTAYFSGLPEKFSLNQEKNAGEDSSPTAAAQPMLPGIDRDAFEDIRSVVTKAILHEHWVKKKPRAAVYKEQELVVGPFLRNLITELTFCLARYNPLLLQCSVDFNPQVNFYWWRGQRIIPKGRLRGHVEPHKFQIDDHPHSQIRIPQQLQEFTSMEASYAAEVPEITVAPNMMPLFRRQYENLVFTGAKMPDPACYGHTQFHLVPDRYRRDRMARLEQMDQVDVFLRANALTSLFAWTGAQAMYQGFWNYEDVTRPFVSQAVITDGHFFNFFCYQLNTLALSVETDANNPRKNILWGNESLRLYDRVEDGEVAGLNDDVIRLLVQFLMNRP